MVINSYVMGGQKQSPQPFSVIIAIFKTCFFSTHVRGFIVVSFVIPSHSKAIQEIPGAELLCFV